MAPLITIRNQSYRNSLLKVLDYLSITTGKILVTGATGLIGSCLVDLFELANEQLGCSFDIYALARNHARLKERFINMSGVHIIAQDVCEPITIDGLDYIIHAASKADPRSYALFPSETILSNVLGAKNVLEYCKCNKRVRVMLMSTFEVYGNLNQDEYSEDDYGLINMNQLRSCYPESKRVAELLFKAFHDEYGVDCVIARLSSVYGPTMLDNDSKAHAQFIRNAMKHENIVLKSEGSQKRTYCYVMDAVGGLLSVLLKGKSGETYNIANSKSIASIAEVANTIAHLTGNKVVFESPDEIERKGFSKPQNSVLSTNKVNELGWEGRYSLLSLSA